MNRSISYDGNVFIFKVLIAQAR